MTAGLGIDGCRNSSVDDSTLFLPPKIFAETISVNASHSVGMELKHLGSSTNVSKETDEKYFKIISTVHRPIYNLHATFTP